MSELMLRGQHCSVQAMAPLPKFLAAEVPDTGNKRGVTPKRPLCAVAVPPTSSTLDFKTIQLYNQLVLNMSGYSNALDATFGALADPTRRAILARLALGEASVKELAEPFAMSQPAISKHLRVLENAGLISRGRDAQRRPCRLEAQALGQASTWLEEYRQFWEESFERLDELLEEMKKQKKRAQKKRGAPR